MNSGSVGLRAMLRSDNIPKGFKPGGHLFFHHKLRHPISDAGLVVGHLDNCETVTLGIKMLYFHCFIARHVGNSTRALSVSVNTIKTCIHRDLFLYNHESNEPQAMNQEQLNILS